MHTGYHYPEPVGLTWPAFKTVSVHHKNGSWWAAYRLGNEAPQAQSHGSSVAPTLALAKALAVQHGLWVVEYDRTGKLVKDSRPLKIRFEFCVQWLKMYGLVKLGKLAIWFLATVLTAWIATSMTAPSSTVFGPVPGMSATAPALSAEDTSQRTSISTPSPAVRSSQQP